MISFAKILSVGLGDLVSARNAALRVAGFEVVAAISLEDVFQQCGSGRFDVAIVGYGFSVQERAEFVRWFRGVLRLPVILIAEGQFLASLQADSHLDVSAPPEDLVCAIQQVLGDKGLSAVAV
jgi:DNA-binding NarL/FixJ family response regulator